MANPRSSTFLNFLVCLLVASCATPPDEVVGKPPEDVESARRAQRETSFSVEKAPRERPIGNPEALALLPGWPFQEEGRRFTLTWDGGSEPVPLFDIPSLNALPIAEAVFGKGEIVRWTQSVVGVYQPTFYRAKGQPEVEGFLVDSEFRTGSETFYAELNAREQVAVYLYAGSGLCFMGVRQKLVEALCPDPDRFSGDFSQSDLPKRFHPPQRIWWVFVGNPGQGGWLALDERMLVDID